MKSILLFFFIISINLSSSLNNGLALTPPMGWMSWLRFECANDCDLDSDNCINENLFKQIADIVVEEGYLDAGYNYVSIDDCWMTMNRDLNGKLQADANRFPNGIKKLADYIHGKGLKLGIYLSIGTKTCAGYPGSHGFIDIDAQTIADWGVDMLKFDGCHATIDDYARDFLAMEIALNRSGRPIVYSCQWPMYAKYFGGMVDYEMISKTCNMFRALTDIYYNYHSVESMILYWAGDPYNFSSVVRPGAWNDPDQMTIGNNGLNENQEKVQMAMWAMIAAPMFVASDLRKIKKISKQILLNKNVIAINQDPLGIQATRYLNIGSILVWEKSILPTGSVAICFLSISKTGAPIIIDYTLDTLPYIKMDETYEVFEVFHMKFLGYYRANSILRISVPPTSVVLLKVVPSRKHFTAR